MDNCDIEKKGESVSKIIQGDFQGEYFHFYSYEDIEFFFDQFDKKIKVFIEYYNKIILDKNEISFGKFNYYWALHLRKKDIIYFDNNFYKLKKLKNEIENEKNIDLFYERYCCKEGESDGAIYCCERNEKIFCCKLFHAILPNEFPLIDNQIMKYFKSSNKDGKGKMDSYKIIHRGYDLFIDSNKEKIDQIKQALTKDKYDYIRIKELSYYRFLDMIYWFILNRKS
jgi:hypothetical protein